MSLQSMQRPHQMHYAVNYQCRVMSNHSLFKLGSASTPPRMTDRSVAMITDSTCSPLNTTELFRNYTQRHHRHGNRDTVTTATSVTTAHTLHCLSQRQLFTTWCVPCPLPPLLFCLSFHRRQLQTQQIPLSVLLHKFRSQDFLSLNTALLNKSCTKMQ